MVYDMKTRKFTPLSEEQRATLNPEQLAAYSGLEAAVDNLAAADTELEAAVTANRAAGEALHEAQAVQKASPKWSRLDEVRAMIAQTRPDTLKKAAPLTVVDPSISAAVNRAMATQADCQMRLNAAADRRRVLQRSRQPCLEPVAERHSADDHPRTADPPAPRLRDPATRRPSRRPRPGAGYAASGIGDRCFRLLYQGARPGHRRGTFLCPWRSRRLVSAIDARAHDPAGLMP